MGFNKGAFQEFNAQDSLDDESSYRTLGDHWIDHSLLKNDILYAGHLYLFSRDIELVNINDSWSDTRTNRIALNVLQNTDLSQYITGDLANLKAVLVYIYSNIKIDGTKVQANTNASVNTNYSFEYNKPTSICNKSSELHERSYAQDADNISLFKVGGNTTIVPVVYYNKIPYITWDITYNFSNMLPVSALYYYIIIMNFLGYFK